MARVSEAFSLGPHAAHVELGGAPLGSGARRRLTLDVMDARWADRLVSERAAGAEDPEHSPASRWSAGDVNFELELRKAGGYVDKSG